ncbi:hypothetical protein DERF_006523 [Dermatophagoides farinae]|uniref:C2H2-type domain-containing protein n=1 Tax=Dermatophagoides farinae TaxID=6954 RepID=A0A922LC66_DERFA|nr:hypothetical protein DERF_006523 [Dermatophagoides farinae]
MSVIVEMVACFFSIHATILVTSESQHSTLNVMACMKLLETNYCVLCPWPLCGKKFPNMWKYKEHQNTYHLVMINC